MSNPAIEPKSDEPQRSLGHLLVNWALPLIALLFVVGMLLTYVQLSRNYALLVERTALQHAAVYSHTLDKFRALYASEVVDTARSAGLLITHDYLTEPNAIPLPITLTRGFEEQFAAPGSGTQTKMYSPLPFAWRQEEGGLKDEFARDAWNALNENPEEPYYRIETYEGVPAMRYAIAETLKPECVSCHNDYEGSPKTDWKVGDVRGVLEVVYPLHNAATLSRRSVWETMGTLTPMLLIALALLGFVTKQHRQWARTLQARVRAQEQALQARVENRDLRSTIDLQTRELLRSREQLMTNEQRLLQMLESLPLGVLVLDAEGEVRYANDHIATLMGGGVFSRLWSGREDDGTAFVADTDMPYPAQSLPSVAALRGVSSTVMDFEWFDGERRVPLLVSGAPILDGSGDVSMAIVAVQDITEQRQLERTAQQAQRMQAVGRLAGGVAHNFNNLLTAIVSCTTFAIRQLDPDHPAYNDLRQVFAAARRGEGLTRQLLAFSRHRNVTRDVISPNQLVGSVEEMLRRLLGEQIVLRTDLSEDLLNVRCESDTLDQVIVNLALNARDAMPRGGELQISTANVTIDAAFAADNGLDLEPGEYVCITVADDGTGMDEKTRRRIFEPFFSTKSHAKGTGLGLSTCWNTVRKLGGELCAISVHGEGTQMKVYLPGVREAVTDKTVAPAHAVARRGQNERIVVVEDDEDVRSSVVRTLQGEGYRVLEACDGREALDLCEVSPPDSIDLIVTDVVMPRMTGPQLACEAEKLHPGVKVLFISGYTDDVFPTVVSKGHIDLLQKPFEPELLARRVRDVLDREPDHLQPQEPT